MSLLLLYVNKLYCQTEEERMNSEINIYDKYVYYKEKNELDSAIYIVQKSKLGKPYVYSRLADIYILKNKLNKAKHLLEKVIEYNEKDNEYSYLRLADIYIAKKKLQ